VQLLTPAALYDLIEDRCVSKLVRFGKLQRLTPAAARRTLAQLKDSTSSATTVTPMDKTIRKYTSFDEMKADEYRYWQSRPVHERMDAVEEMIRTAYALKGWEIEPDVPRLQRPFVRLPCPWR
jgi:hypothetical protein